MKLSLLGLLITITLLQIACGGGGSSSTPSPTPTPTPQVTISGALSFDDVPNDTDGALDYSAIQALPIRGVTVQAVTAGDLVMASGQSDEEGRYQLQVNINTEVRIRVLAELVEQGMPSWDFRVTDNTNGNAQYVLDGELLSSGTANSQRDLHAASGWNGVRYSDTRAAAPFAILDAVYDGLQMVLATEPLVQLGPAELRWSVLNTPQKGTLSEGLIGSSFYDPGEDNMYILGDEGDDTDEYDRSVILHEWGHYLEDALSRSDSIGGSHSLGGSFDMRLAYSEGFANAFAAIASGLSVYTDSSGPSQRLGFDFSLEENTIGNAGWFSQNSIGKIFYDIADENNEAGDELSLGFDGILQAMTADQYVLSDALISIYVFAESIKSAGDETVQEAVDSLLRSQSITGTGIYGEGETNDSANNISFALPVYHSLVPGETVNLCGNNRQSEFNGLDVRRFVHVNIAEAGRYTFRAVKTLGTGERDPDLVLLHRGRVVSGGRLNSKQIDQESGTIELSAGEYVLEVFDYLNIDLEDGGGSSCFDVSINAS